MYKPALGQGLPEKRTGISFSFSTYCSRIRRPGTVNQRDKLEWVVYKGQSGQRKGR